MEKEEIIRKLAAIFSADVKGYSSLMQDDEAATVLTLTTYRDLMFTLIQQHHGRVVDSPGDNILAEFSSVVDAVQGAVAIQKELKERNTQLQEHRKMEFRIGINLGDIIIKENRIYGDGVNIAARLEGMSDAGGICISRTAYDQIEDKLPLGYEYMGEQVAKNMQKPLRAYKVNIWSKDVESLTDISKDTKKRKIRHKKAANKFKPPKIKIKLSNTKTPKVIETDAEKQDRLSRSFSYHLKASLGLIGFFCIINILTWSFWFYWPALVLGLGLFFHWRSLVIMSNTEKLTKAQQGFSYHLMAYVGVIGFLFGINILTWSFWFYWPALLWGFGLFFHWISHNRTPG